uniref:Uncharacterized protein n=1 Tax=Romanomermis culicivorax TaxID=13658 RepID=A0A915IRL8_ROMCU
MDCTGNSEILQNIASGPNRQSTMSEQSAFVAMNEDSNGEMNNFFICMLSEGVP